MAYSPFRYHISYYLATGATGTTLTDTSAVAWAATPVDTLLVDRALPDTPAATSAFAGGTDLVSNATVLPDTPAAAYAAFLIDTLVVERIFLDAPTAAYAAASLTDTLATDRTLTDQPSAASASSAGGEQISNAQILADISGLPAFAAAPGQILVVDVIRQDGSTASTAVGSTSQHVSGLTLADYPGFCVAAGTDSQATSSAVLTGWPPLVHGPFLEPPDGAGSVIPTSITVSGVASVAGRTGAVSLTAFDVGLGQVNNTPDTSKPVSAAQQAALDAKASTVHAHTEADVTNLMADQSALSTAVAGKAAASHAHTEADVTGLASDLTAKATDTTVVHLAGTENITGAKTFTSPPTVPTPTAGGHAVTKTYADGLTAAGAPVTRQYTAGAWPVRGVATTTPVIWDGPDTSPPPIDATHAYDGADTLDVWRRRATS